MRAPYKATYVLSRVSTDPAYVLSHLCMEPPMCGPAYVLSCLCTEPLCQSRLYSCRLYTVAGLYSVAACTVCSRLYSGRLIQCGRLHSVFAPIQWPPIRCGRLYCGSPYSVCVRRYSLARLCSVVAYKPPSPIAERCFRASLWRTFATVEAGRPYPTKIGFVL
jgi:hypothetical protein